MLSLLLSPEENIFHDQLDISQTELLLKSFILLVGEAWKSYPPNTSQLGIFIGTNIAVITFPSLGFSVR